MGRIVVGRQRRVDLADSPGRFLQSAGPKSGYSIRKLSFPFYTGWRITAGVSGHRPGIVMEPLLNVCLGHGNAKAKHVTAACTHRFTCGGWKRELLKSGEQQQRSQLRARQSNTHLRTCPAVRAWRQLLPAWKLSCVGHRCPQRKPEDTAEAMCLIAVRQLVVVRRGVDATDESLRIERTMRDR